MSDEATHTLVVPTPASSPSDRALRIVVVAGKDVGKSQAIEGSRAVVGRSVNADVRVLDPTVSQFHVELTVTHDGAIHVRDLGSRNGTRVGSVAVETGTVPPGTALALGATTIRVELAGTVTRERANLESFGALVGSSTPMRELYALMQRLARTDLPVLIEGETGTGKEVAARALHDAGTRAGKPFVVLDCTAIPANLAESILFGHEKGAFTDAREKRGGIFEAAQGGTVLLDEIGELPADLQPKLLRVLERREVVPVGSTKPRPIDVRVVSATWRDLRRMINDGSFREDLYYRLVHARLRMPPLRERPDDIELLARHTLARISPDAQAARDLDPDALAMLQAREWPGNVRELMTTVERAALLAEGASINAADLTFERRLASEGAHARPSTGTGENIEDFKTAKQTLIDDFERGYLERLLARTGSNISRAAALAGIGRHTLRELMRRHGFRGED